MRHPILFAVLLGFATPLAAQDEAPDGARVVEVSEDFVLTGGEDIYRGLCQGCHQPDGGGAQGAGYYPALAGNQNLEYPEYAVSLVLHGHRAMPPFGALLDDAQVAAVVRFIQTQWGNVAEVEASPDLVEDFRY